MPKHPRQKLKLLHLQRLLLTYTDENHWLTMDEILYHLEQAGIHAERKSIYGDIQALRDFGMDILQKRGKNGGYYLTSREFEIAELKLMVDAIQSSRFITHRKSRELIHKIETLASQPQARLLQRQVYVFGRAKTINEGIYRNIDTLHEAITNGNQIRFRYFEWKADFVTHRHIVKHYRRAGQFYQASPWALMWDHENYYLIAFDQEADLVKHYRVDKMEALEITGVQREGKQFFERFDLADYARKTFGMFRGKEQWVRMKCENRFISALYDRFGEAIALSPCDDTSFYANVNVAVRPQFYAWVFGLGGAVKIVAPPEIVQDFQNLNKKFV